MSRDRKWIVDLIARMITGPSAQIEAEVIVDRLNEEGVLHLGYGNADIDIVTDAFKDIFGTTKISNTDRFAARRLSEKYGAQAVLGIMRLLAQHSQEPYAPVVGSMAELESKWVKVLNFVRKISQDSNNETIQTP